MKTKKRSLAHICAYLSLAISITMLVLWCCNVGGFTVVSLDSFVGVIVGLLAIVVTLAIGWQIYNSIEIKSKIEELDMLKEKLQIQEQESKTQGKTLNHLIFTSLADIEINNKNYVLAFSYLMTSLESTMSLDNPINTDAILVRMENLVHRVKEDTVCKFMDEIQDSNDCIRESPLYDMIRIRYEKTYADFTAKTKINDAKG